jgi:hypothetical protein
MSIAANRVDALLVRPVYGHGLVVPQTFIARLEFRRTVHESPIPGRSSGNYPIGYVEQHHARIRWARFALVWAALGAQMRLEHEVES